MKSSNKSNKEKYKDKNTQEKKSKTQNLSPCFRKGVIKTKEKNKKENYKDKEEDDGQFIINQINIKKEKKEGKEESKRPKKNKSKKDKVKEKDRIKEKGHHHCSSLSKIENIVNALPEGRIKKVSSYSQPGKLEDGFIKLNQDSFLVLQNLYNFTDFNIFSVMDGHGINGHLISNFLTKYIISFFKNNKKLNSSNNENEIYYRLKKNNSDILKKVFKGAERDLEKNSVIDANFSGTTCVMVMQIGEKILCANVGDSRAILVKEYLGIYKIIPLSIEQKPDDPEESKRIIENGGEICQFEEDGETFGPYRVWKKGKPYPGITLSRSIGDLVATTLGVVPVPNFFEETIDCDTKFIVIASDGLWEFLSNKNVAEIVMFYYKKNDPNGACKALIKESTEYWNQEDVVVDDITVIVVFF